MCIMGRSVLLLLLCFTWWRVIGQEGFREEVSVILSVWCIMVVVLSSTHCAYLQKKLKGYPEDILNGVELFSILA